MKWIDGNGEFVLADHDDDLGRNGDKIAVRHDEPPAIRQAECEGREAVLQMLSDLLYHLRPIYPPTRREQVGTSRLGDMLGAGAAGRMACFCRRAPELDTRGELHNKNVMQILIVPRFARVRRAA